MKTKEIICNILTELCGIEEITPDLSLKEDLGLDSLGRITLLMELEEQLQIELEESDMNPFDLICVGDIFALAEKYRGASDEESS